MPSDFAPFSSWRNRRLNSEPDQNKAVKHIVRKQFDDAYLNICRLAYPDMNMGASGGEYYLEPNAKGISVREQSDNKRRR